MSAKELHVYIFCQAGGRERETERESPRCHGGPRTLSPILNTRRVLEKPMGGPTCLPPWETRGEEVLVRSLDAHLTSPSPPHAALFRPTFPPNRNLIDFTGRFLEIFPLLPLKRIHADASFLRPSPVRCSESRDFVILGK